MIGLVKIHGVPLALHQFLALVVVFMVAARCDEGVVMVTREVLSTGGATYSAGKTRKSYTPPETNIKSLQLKIDGWKTSFLLGWPIFRGYVSFREGI